MRIEVIVNSFHPNNLRLVLGEEEDNLTVTDVVELRDKLNKWLEYPIFNV